MIDFILKYWLELLFTIITSCFFYVFKEYVGLKNGLKALLRNEIVRIYETYIQFGFCPSYMKENINEIYINYHKLGGNGFATSMVNDLFKLPNNLKESEEFEKNIE